MPVAFSSTGRFIAPVPTAGKMRPAGAHASTTKDSWKGLEKSPPSVHFNRGRFLPVEHGHSG
jgi:hypothetical protein